MKTVCELTGLSSGTINRQIKAKAFPNRLLLTSEGSVGFFEDEVASWIESRQPVTAETQRQVAPGSTKRGRPRHNKCNGGVV